MNYATVYELLGRPLVDTFVTGASQDDVDLSWDVELQFTQPIAMSH